MSLAELACWLERNHATAPEAYINTVKESSTILDITEEIATGAGKNLCELRKTAPDFGMIDAIIYTQAASSGIQLLTGDPHFKKLANVEFVE
ncbi:hypothetical protein AUJ13_03860 [Candidatus Micrarchaeota archaeon CG1_02_49_24]|nr:MAG: hypothetical protein AUJ13_03860 [Candidatus Micrarchaeota archaeon CG1_02_49_24]HII53830.1 type II toxin-antitoxin system VapC family toxin [Candidatus Micrarchaeota archaeon]